MWWIGVAHAWDVNSVDWVYQEARIEEPFVLNLDSFEGVAEPAEIEALFQSALDTWNAESDADLFIAYGGTSQVTRQGGGDDGVNVAVFGSVDFFAGLAVSTIGYSGQRLNDCDMAFHSRNGYGAISWYVGEDPAPNGSFDLANTMTHEVGHCIGMNHSQRETAIMYAYSVEGTGEEARHLSDDDRAGIQFLYGLVTPELVEESATFTAEPVHGEAVPVELAVRNIGDGSAYFVTGTVNGASLALPHIGSPTAVGARVGPDVATIEATWTMDCAVTSATFEATLTDRRERSWTLAWEIPVDCAVPEPEPPTTDDGTTDATADGGGEAAGCGCATAPTTGWPAGFGLLALLAARRRSTTT